MFFRKLELPALIPLQHSAENDVKGRFLCAFVWPYIRNNMTFYVTTDGGYVTLLCKSGTEDEVDAKDAWLTAGGNLESLRISATSNTTGAERKLDVVIVDSDNWNELFRIPVTQAAK